MIEKDIINQKMKEYQIQEYVAEKVRRCGYSNTVLQRTPLGEKIIVYASRPGLVVGRQGQNIRNLTEELKEKFGLENPQIEVGEVGNIHLDVNIVAEMIALSLERFGSQRFKAVMHKTLMNIMNAGALGVEIHISGKLPSARARSWRVYAGYLKKCGDISVSGVKKAQAIAQLKSGIIGIKVSIMPPDIELPDKVEFIKDKLVVEETKEIDQKENDQKEEPKPVEKPKKTRTRKKKSEDNVNIKDNVEIKEKDNVEVKEE